MEGALWELSVGFPIPGRSQVVLEGALDSDFYPKYPVTRISRKLTIKEGARMETEQHRWVLHLTTCAWSLPLREGESRVVP